MPVASIPFPTPSETNSEGTNDEPPERENNVDIVHRMHNVRHCERCNLSFGTKQRLKSYGKTPGNRRRDTESWRDASPRRKNPTCASTSASLLRLLP
ncbi:hypothetical protein IMZ48_34650 [Candidatus Bathyarchaeota archaeon]|nr:hypothetical protein [Candidatus Bathyarchaeota archaeon]